MNAPMQDRVITEIEHLRSEFSCQRDAAKSSQLYAAMQALEWVKNPDNAAAPTWIILAGKAQPLMAGIPAG